MHPSDPLSTPPNNVLPTPTTPLKTVLDPPPKRGSPPLFAIFFLLLFPVGLFALFLYNRFSGLNPGGLTPTPNRAAFFLDMPTLDGPRFTLSDHAGKVLVINYFATWCGPCQDELPDLEKIAADYASRDVEVAAVGLDSDADSPLGALETLKRFAKAERPPFPILLPPDLASQRTEIIPYTYLIDRHGRIAYFILGRLEAPHLRSLIDQLLKEP